MKTTVCVRTSAWVRSHALYFVLCLRARLCVFVWVCVWMAQTMMAFYVVKIARMNWNEHPIQTTVAISSNSNSRILCPTVTLNQRQRRQRDIFKSTLSWAQTHTDQVYSIFLNKQNKSAPVIMGVIERWKYKRNMKLMTITIYETMFQIVSRRIQINGATTINRALYGPLLWVCACVCVHERPCEWVHSLKALYWRNHKLLFIKNEAGCTFVISRKILARKRQTIEKKEKNI